MSTDPNPNPEEENPNPEQAVPTEEVSGKYATESEISRETAPPEPPAHEGQVLNPLELPANPLAAAQYPGEVDPNVPISEERAEQARKAIAEKQDELPRNFPDDPRLERSENPE